MHDTACSILITGRLCCNAIWCLKFKMIVASLICRLIFVVNCIGITIYGSGIGLCMCDVGASNDNDDAVDPNRIDKDLELKWWYMFVYFYNCFNWFILFSISFQFISYNFFSIFFSYLLYCYWWYWYHSKTRFKKKKHPQPPSSPTLKCCFDICDSNIMYVWFYWFNNNNNNFTFWFDNRFLLRNIF